MVNRGDIKKEGSIRLGNYLHVRNEKREEGVALKFLAYIRRWR